MRSIDQIPVGDCTFTAFIWMSLRRYVLKTCCKVPECTKSLTFGGKGLKYFANMYREIYCGHLLCRRLIDSVELSSTVSSFLSRYHGYHIFVYLFRVFRHSGPPLLRESYINFYLVILVLNQKLH